MPNTAMPTQYWLAKSEPEAYSIYDLKRTKTTLWDGVRNYQVRNFFRDTMQAKDRVLFYHSNTKTPGVVGEMEVVDTHVVDPTQFDVSDEHFDPKSTHDTPRWLAPKMKFVRMFKDVLTLDEMKHMSALQHSPLVRKGNRLSVIPLTKSEYTALIQRAAT